MSRFELTMNVDYVPHWTVQDGLRELIQNALDESVINSANSMSITRDGNTLLISTRNAKLDKSSLLIGSSSKRDDSKTIGKEGEGYKLACLVLVRSGHKVQINNYHEKEKWVPKIIKSRRYKSKLLVIDTEKFVFLTPANSDLTFKVEGITDEIYEELIKRTLFLGTNVRNTLKCKEIGEVLLDEKEAGRVYVGGLYVATIEDGLKFGYNFNPDKIILDRDRRAVTDFNLTWETSKLWLQIGNRHNKLLSILVKTDCKDVAYINDRNNTSTDNKIANNTYFDFRNEFGDNAFPVSNQTEHDFASKTYKDVKPIIVNETRQNLIKSSSKFNSVVSSFDKKETDKTPTEILEDFKTVFDSNFSQAMTAEFNNIIRISTNW